MHCVIITQHGVEVRSGIYKARGKTNKDLGLGFLQV